LTDSRIARQTVSANQGQTAVADPIEAAPWTIKAVPVETRQKAVKAANADGQTVGQFLVEAVNLLVEKRAGNLILPAGPDPTHNPLTPDQLTARIMAVAALQQSTAAMKQASGRATGKLTLTRCLGSLDQHMIEAEGLPPRPPRTIAGKANGQASTRTETAPATIEN
jgi:hypothetical protein